MVDYKEVARSLIMRMHCGVDNLHILQQGIDDAAQSNAMWFVCEELREIVDDLENLIIDI